MSNKEYSIDKLNIVLKSYVEFCHDQDKVGYGVFKVGDFSKVLKIDSSEFSNEIRRIANNEFKKVMNNSAVKEIQEHCKALAYFGPQKEINMRYASKNGAIYVDLMVPKGGVVKITKAGYRVVKPQKVLFYRRSVQKSLSRPVKGKGGNALRQLFPNIENNEFKLLLLWMMFVIHFEGPFPMMIIQGQQGSAKSFLMEIVRDLLDPVKAPLLSLPRSERDLVLTTLNNTVLAFDNVSSLPKWMPDAFCRIATGAGFSTRKLYSDDEEKVFEFCRPIIINGIADFVVKSDLADRSIILNMQSISPSKRLPKKKLWDQYQQVKPAILSFLYGSVATALKNIDTIDLAETPRMADFAIFSCAASSRLNWTEQKFLDAYAAISSSYLQFVMIPIL